jgi:hypothetical protein
MNNVGISIGFDCLSARYGVYSKLRLSKKDKYNTCPFDLMFSNYTGVVTCILDDFKYFTDLTYLQYNSKNKTANICNTYYKFEFNHETPFQGNFCQSQKWPNGQTHFTNNNFEKFIERYNNRINNFRNYCSDINNFITFILFPGNTHVGDCKEFKEAIAVKYPMLKYKIIIINGPLPHNVTKTIIVKTILKET